VTQPHALSFGDAATSDDKTMALLSHLSIYVATFIGPLVFWLIFKEKSTYIKYHAMQALIFQAALWILSVVIGAITVVTCGFGGVLYLVLVPLFFVPLYGAYVAYNGEWSGFPGLSGFGR